MSISLNAFCRFNFTRQKKLYDQHLHRQSLPCHPPSIAHFFLSSRSLQMQRATQQSAVHIMHVNPYSRNIVKKFLHDFRLQVFPTRCCFTSSFFSIRFIFVFGVLAISGRFTLPLQASRHSCQIYFIELYALPIGTVKHSPPHPPLEKKTPSDTMITVAMNSPAFRLIAQN